MSVRCKCYTHSTSRAMPIRCKCDAGVYACNALARSITRVHMFYIYPSQSLAIGLHARGRVLFIRAHTHIAIFLPFETGELWKKQGLEKELLAFLRFVFNRLIVFHSKKVFHTLAKFLFREMLILLPTRFKQSNPTGGKKIPANG